MKESKTEFLFESDAEKVVLKNALEPKRKTHKKIIINTIVICFLLVGTTVSLNYYEINEINNIKASLVRISEVNEKLNASSDNLKVLNNNYNDKYSIIVNKANPISSDLMDDYKLVIVKNNLYNNIKLEEETYMNYLKLRKNLKQRGYYINIKTGFINFNESKLKGGTSEHNTGLCFDFIISSNKNSYEDDYQKKAHTYLENIAYLYGFIIRYPKGKEKVTGYDYEPNHLRYVGVDLAKYLKKNNLALEELYK